MIPENNLEEPDISQVAYELAAQLIRHLDNLEANTSAGITGLVFSLKSSFFPWIPVFTKFKYYINYFAL